MCVLHRTSMRVRIILSTETRKHDGYQRSQAFGGTQEPDFAANGQKLQQHTAVRTEGRRVWQALGDQFPRPSVAPSKDDR